MKYIGLIPARYASTRFPGKPLAMLCGKPVIQRVYETVASCLDEAYVCTDDERILLTARFDNLGKGACGAAIQNLNLLTGADETKGLVV